MSIINPIYLLAFIYTISNFIGYLSGIQNQGYIFSQNIAYKISSTSYHLAIISQISFIIMILLFWKYFNALKISNTPKKINTPNRLLVIYLSMYMLFNYITGAGIAGSDAEFTDYNIIIILFIILNPDLIFIVMAPFLPKRYFFISSSIYLASTLLRGWMGGVYIVMIILLIRMHKVKFKAKIVRGITILTLIIILILPILYEIKWGIRAKLTPAEVTQKIFTGEIITYQQYIESLNDTIKRFQHINNIALVIENASMVKEQLYSDQFRRPYENGIIYNIYCRLFENCLPDISVHIATYYYNGTGSWNVDPGFFTWLFIFDPKSFLFLILSPALIYILSKSIVKKTGYQGLLSLYCFSFVYLFHGWYAAFYNFSIYFLLIIYLSNFTVRSYIVRFATR